MQSNTLIIRTKDGNSLPQEVESKILAAVRITMTENSKVICKPIETNEERIRTAIRNRIESAGAAFKLICKIKKASWLDDYIDENQQKYLKAIDNLQTFEDCEEQLIAWMKHLDCVVMQVFAMDSIQFKKWMGIADNYVVAGTQKPILMTVTQNERHDQMKQYYVQIDTPLSPFSESIAKEYANARTTPAGMFFAHAPEWYREMDVDERLFFDFHMRELLDEKSGVKLSKIAQRIPAISSKDRTKGGVANYFEHRFVVYDGQTQLVYASPSRYRSSIVASRDINVKNSSLRLNIASNNYLRIIKRGYADIISCFIKEHHGITSENIEHLIKRLENAPILLQTLISPIAAASSFIPDPDLYNDKLRAIKQIKNKGIGISFTVDGKPVHCDIDPKNIFETNHSQNIARKVLSTNGYFNVSDTGEQLNKLADYAVKHLELIQDKLKVLKVEIDKLQTQKEDMVRRRSYLHYPDNSCPTIENLTTEINKLERVKLKLERRLNTLQAARLELVELLTPTADYADQARGRRRELHLAGLEEYIMGLLPDAISHGSCVSGKDRKGLETIYVDAMHLYWIRCGKIPKLNDNASDRTRFCKIYAELYATYHQHICAGLNAPGADGIKTIDDYLPEDILNEIFALTSKIESRLSDQLANNNDLKELNYTSLVDGSKERADIQASLLAFRSRDQFVSARIIKN